MDLQQQQQEPAITDADVDIEAKASLSSYNSGSNQYHIVFAVEFVDVVCLAVAQTPKGGGPTVKYAFNRTFVSFKLTRIDFQVTSDRRRVKPDDRIIVQTGAFANVWR